MFIQMKSPGKVSLTGAGALGNHAESYDMRPASV